MKTSTRTLCPQPAMYTFHRYGPQYLTYLYPVNTDPLNEIINEDGCIDASYYKNIPGAFDAIKDYSNEWFLHEAPEECCEHFRKDMLLLAQRNKEYGAYTILSSISSNRDDASKYMERAARHGIPEGMVTFGMYLILDKKKVEEGFEWIKKGADLNNEIGIVSLAISYNFGVFTPVNLDYAAEYYLRAIRQDESFVAYNNLGVLLVGAGFYNSALKYFKAAYDLPKKKKEEAIEFGAIEDYLNNLDYCKKLLDFPYEGRKKRTAIQAHSPLLPDMFCDGKAPDSVANPEEDVNLYHWCPANKDLIDPLDLEERAQCIEKNSKPQDNMEDYRFPILPLQLKNEKGIGTSHELIFLERPCHTELNTYIKSNIMKLRKSFKDCGYIFTYMPSRIEDPREEQDKFGFYLQEDGGTHQSLAASIYSPSDNYFWGNINNTDNIPIDCAGFLRYVPIKKHLYDHSHFDFILFPHTAGTNWNKAFASLFAFLKTIPINSIAKSTNQVVPKCHHMKIDGLGNITILDVSESEIANIKMPTLSKVLYLAYLNHPEGIAIKELIDYKDELLKYYQQIAGEKANPQNIETLVNPINNSANEKISRIRSAFHKALEDYPTEIDPFIPIGKRGEKYKVAFCRDYISIAK